MLATRIVYCEQKLTLICDGKCHKAWGINCRPKVQLSDNEDDTEYLADDELGEAPEDPGIYEGDDAKPRNPSQRHNKWCARECERERLVEDGVDFRPKDFSRRVRNIPRSFVCDRCGTEMARADLDSRWMPPKPKLCKPCQKKERCG